MPTIVIKKKDKRNRQRYSFVELRCEIGSPVVTIIRGDGTTKTFNKHELEICDVLILNYHYKKYSDFI